jgi:hypothetical protein
VSGLPIAFKEWAVICDALAHGDQTIILRKGGIAETGPTFEAEHPRFWLYPTYLHQKADALVPAARSRLEQVEAERTPMGLLRLSHVAEVAAVYSIREEETALRLAGLHLWSAATVRQRFHYRRPGLTVLAVRVAERMPTIEVAETAAYAGCKSWVELDQPLPTEGARPVISDERFAETLRVLDALLRSNNEA